MRGELICVWGEMWADVWEKISMDENAPSDLFCELFREIVPALTIQLSPEQLADIIDDQAQALESFKRLKPVDFSGERALVAFLERAHNSFDDLGGDHLGNLYFNLLNNFIIKYSLRYDLRRPCSLCPTLAGIFSSLIRDLKNVTSSDVHLNRLMKDFEDSLRDLNSDSTENRIKTCISKQMNLLEALGRNMPGVSANTLGAICNQVNSWPHDDVKDAIKSLYSFASDYPGIRHGGTPANAIRDIELRDMIAIVILLMGFTPYLSEQVNAEIVFKGK